MLAHSFIYFETTDEAKQLETFTTSIRSFFERNEEPLVPKVNQARLAEFCRLIDLAACRT